MRGKIGSQTRWYPRPGRVHPPLGTARPKDIQRLGRNLRPSDHQSWWLRGIRCPETGARIQASGEYLDADLLVRTKRAILVKRGGHGCEYESCAISDDYSVGRNLGRNRELR